MKCAIQQTWKDSIRSIWPFIVKYVKKLYADLIYRKREFCIGRSLLSSVGFTNLHRRNEVQEEVMQEAEEEQDHLMVHMELKDQNIQIFLVQTIRVKSLFYIFGDSSSEEDKMSGNFLLKYFYCISFSC